MKIAIDLGHGCGQDRGAVGAIKEETIINEVGIKVVEKLKAAGHDVIQVRPSGNLDVSQSLAYRVNLANSNNSDLYVSIHANAGRGQGCEVYTYQGKEVTEARRVLNNICSLGFKNRGIKNANLYVINNTKMTAMLIEVCFVDTQSDVNLYNSVGADKIAAAIGGGLSGNVTTTITTNLPYLVKVTTTALNVREEPNTRAHITTVIKQNEVYTIVGVRNNWGKLKSGAGWICLNYVKKV